MSRPQALRAAFYGALAAIALSLACSDSSTAPKQNRLTIALGDSVEGTVAAGDSVVYYLSAAAGVNFVVHLQARAGSISASVRDATGSALGSADATSGGSSYWTLVSVPAAGEYRIVVAAPVGSAGGGYAVHPVAVAVTPERVSAVIQPGDTVTGETLESGDDVDEFTVDLAAGQEVELFLQALAPSSTAPSAELRMDGTVGTAPAVAATAAASTDDLESRSTGRVTLTATGRYRLRVHNALLGSNRGYVGEYRFMLYAINRAPERAAATLTPGDTVSESIDHVGDIDEFTLTASAGKQFNLFAEAGGAAPHRAVVSVYAADSATAGAVTIVRAEPGQKLLDVASGRFTMPATGRLLVRVADQSAALGLFRGPYRLLVYPIDSAPESRSAEIVPSRTPVGDAIDQLGDIDVYHMTLDSAQDLAFVTDRPTGIGAPLQFSFTSDVSGRMYDLNAAPAGSYHVTVQPLGTGQAGDFRGPYQFALAAIDSRPEVAPAAIAVGDLITTETVAWPRDVDRFRLTTATADTFVAVLTRPPGDTSWSRQLTVVDPATGRSVQGSALLAWDGDRMPAPRIILPAGGSIELDVAGSTSRWAPTEAGAYQLSIQRVSAAPEHHAADIALGDTVRDSLDYWGDIDDFVLRGTPGQDIDLQATWPLSYAPPSFDVLLMDPTTDSVLARSSTLGSTYSVPTTIPAGGVVRVRACVGPGCGGPCDAAICSAGTHPLLPYWLLVRSINRAPESIPATFAFGDTVSGESIDRINDIDEFTFSGTVGEKIDVAFQWLLSGAAPGLRLDLVDATTGATVTSIVSNGSKPALDDVSTGTITLANTGTYILRIRAEPDTSGFNIRTTGPYRFRVTAVP